MPAIDMKQVEDYMLSQQREIEFEQWIDDMQSSNLKKPTP
jgi:hypothetical protein